MMPAYDQARGASRFVTEESVPGTFALGSDSFKVSVRDVSVGGAQIEHTERVRPGMQGRLTIGKLDAPAVVIWTRMTPPGRYRSGLRIEERHEVIAAAIREMLSRGVIRKPD